MSSKRITQKEVKEFNDRVLSGLYAELFISSVYDCSIADAKELARIAKELRGRGISPKAIEDRALEDEGLD